MTTPPLARSRKTNPLASSSRCPIRRGSAARRRPRRTARPRGSSRRAASPAPGSSVCHSSPAVALEHRQHRIPVRQRALRRRPRRTRAPASPTRAAAAARRCGRSRRRSEARPRSAARGPRRRRLRTERLELLAGVGRGVDEKPRPVAAADRERRLRPRSRAHTLARGLTRRQWQFHCGNPPPAAEPRTRTRTRHDEAVRSLRRTPEATPASDVLPVVEVGSDLGAEVDELKLGLIQVIDGSPSLEFTV